MTAVEARNRFGQLLDAVQREPVAITRHGLLAAFLISPQEMSELLSARRRRKEAVVELEEWSARSLKQASPEALSLTDEEVRRLVHEAR